jgi:hypothetical protein
MAWSATELQIMVCCDLVRNDNWDAAMLLRWSALDYEEKNDTAFITITAPRGSYDILEILNNSWYTDTFIIPEELEPKITLECDLITRAIYHAFAMCVLDPILGTPTSLQVRVKPALDPTELGTETPVANQDKQIDKGKSVHIWENLRFRSITEMRIAKELDRRKVLFFPNCKARLGFKSEKTGSLTFSSATKASGVFSK